MNRDPAMTKWRILVLLSVIVMVGFGVLLAQTQNNIDWFQKTSDDFVEKHIEFRKETLEIKVNYEAEKTVSSK